MNFTIGIVILISAVFIGGFIVIFLQKLNRDKLIKMLLSLSGGFLLAIAFVHFIPEIYENEAEKVGYYILLGFLIQLILEYFSEGIEHGHIHENRANGAIPWGLFIALSFHSFFEGIPLEATFSGASGEYIDNTQALLWGIFLHKIPVAIALMTLLLASGFTKSKAWIVLCAFALMSPLGVLFGRYGSDNLDFNIGIVLAIVVGMFLHISTTIVFESSENHKFNFVKLMSLFLGVGLALIAI